MTSSLELVASKLITTVGYDDGRYLTRSAEYLLCAVQRDNHRRINTGKAAVFEDAFDDEPLSTVLDVDFQLTAGL